MGHAPKLCTIFLGGLLAAVGCNATRALDGQEFTSLPAAPGALAPPADAVPAVAPDLPAAPVSQPDDHPLPINLPSALQLANVRAVDIAAATARLRVAAALLDQAQVLWLPSLTLGGDYNRHDGRIQQIDGTIINASRSSGMLGLGSAIGPAGIFDITNAIFTPLSARQQLRARQADRQAASNDTLVAVSDAYFNVQQARGELAGAHAAMQRTEELIRRAKKLAPDVVPELEVFRAEAELARRQTSELQAREHWKVASAELLRVLLLDPSAQVEPVEPPQLRIDLIDLKKPVDDLIAVGLTYRPELASQQAQIQATLVKLKQEKLRPLIPSLLVRGWSTPVTSTFAAGYFGGGTNGSFGNGGLREDIDVQLLWQLNNLGLGNLGMIRQRQAENRLAVLGLTRLQARIAAEIAQAYAQARLAAQRVEVTGRGLQAAVQSADKNLVALGQTKGVGALTTLLVRPQEVVAAIQTLSQAYLDYYGAVADANRAQFRLYRALGQPAQFLVQEEQRSKLCAPELPAPATLAPPTAEVPPAPRLQPPVLCEPGALVPGEASSPPRASVSSGG